MGEVPSSTTDLGESEHNAPHFTLVTKTIFPYDLEFGVPEAEVNFCSIDMSRASSCFNGREILTNERPRKLWSSSVQWSNILILEDTYDDVAPCRFYCTSVVP